MARILKFLQGRKMTKNERVAAALKGDHVDAVPVSAWWHDFEREWSASDLAEATLEAYRKYDWDFIKVNPRASYFGEAFGAKYAQRLMKENPDELLAALAPIAETLTAYSKASLDAGAAGIFFATVEWGSGDVISIEDYNRFARPFDLKVLEGVKGAPFNVLHV